MNHIMFGEIGAWLFKALGGIRADPEQPGFKNILLEPHFVSGLDQFSAEHHGPPGKIVSAWQRTKRGILYSVTVPPNTTATLRLTIGEGVTVKVGGIVVEKSEGIETIERKGSTRIYRLEAGSYEFEIKR